MTDMMVGVLFIFIIMLSYFSFNYRATTSDLTSAKDAQTTLLLKEATALERKDVVLEIDHKAHIVCIPGTALTSGDSSADMDRHCFAYTADAAPKLSAKDNAVKIAEADKAAFMASVGADIKQSNLPITTSIDNGTLSFTADQLFASGSASFTPSGQAIAQKIAATLAQELPCYAYGVPPTHTCAGDTKMSVVNVASSLSFNAFTPEGREAQALALQRSVALHDALIANQPILGKLRNAPDGQALLQVTSYGQSNTNVAASGSGETISIQFYMAQ
ncbi:MAG: hypothetical protein WBQ60_13150 [Asticcacaulis sp.]